MSHQGENDLVAVMSPWLPALVTGVPKRACLFLFCDCTCAWSLPFSRVLPCRLTRVRGIWYFSRQELLFRWLIFFSELLLLTTWYFTNKEMSTEVHDLIEGTQVVIAYHHILYLRHIQDPLLAIAGTAIGQVSRTSWSHITWVTLLS